MCLFTWEQDIWICHIGLEEIAMDIPFLPAEQINQFVEKIIRWMHTDKKSLGLTDRLFYFEEEETGKKKRATEIAKQKLLQRLDSISRYVIQRCPSYL